MKEILDLDAIADSEIAIRDSDSRIQKKVERVVSNRMKKNPDEFRGEVIRDVYEQIRYNEDQSIPRNF